MYHSVYEAWKKDPEGFWAEESKAIDWFEEPTKIFDEDMGVYGRWFTDGVVNTCYNCLDRHVQNNKGDNVALIYDSPVTNTVKKFTYNDLLADVSAFSAALKSKGVGKGDRVIIYMPMIPQTVVAVLACARIGAIHSVVFGGFAANELATRIDDCEAKLVVSASCGIEGARTIAYKPLLDDAIELSKHKPEATIIYQREQLAADMVEGRDFDFDQALLDNKGAEVPCEPMKATDPLYILYTSGTTGQPKGVVRDNGGHLVALNWTMHNIYGVKPGEVFWAASDVGWVVGHSYIIYGPLLSGNPGILFEGKPIGTPDAGTFWRIISEHKVKSLFTAPTAFRAIRKEDPNAEFIKKYDLSDFEALFLAGERADPDTIKWAEDVLKVPVIDHWWQTETGWTIAGNPMGLGFLPVKYGSPAVPMPGYDVQIVNDEGEQIEANELGNIVVKLPLPPGSMPTLWNAEERFIDAYMAEFPGYYKTADAGYIDEDGYLYIMARTDDIINVAGHRLSTGGIEEAIASHESVAECAVVGVTDKLKGQLPIGFVVVNSAVEKSAQEVEAEIVAQVRSLIGPVAAFKSVILVPRLPKTRSGKILRGTMQKIYDGLEWKMPATIDDPAILDEIKSAIDVYRS